MQNQETSENLHLVNNKEIVQMNACSDKDQSLPPRKIKSGYKDSVEVKLQPVPHEPPTSRSNGRSQQVFCP